MARTSQAQTSFNGGELSPLMEGRADFAKYATGCALLENFIPTVQGPARKRAGSHYVDTVLDSTKRSWFGRFEFSYDQAFVLEFSDNDLGFFTDRGRLLSLGVPYTITTPYANADLVNSDGGFALSMVQSGDVIYIAGGSQPPQKLTRLGNTNWTIAELQPSDGPWMDQNTTEATTVYASGATGSITITASASIFTANHVGALIRLEVQDLSKVRPWEPAKSISTNDLRRSDGKTYEAQNASTTGSVKPTHSKGTAYDGSDSGTGVNWEFQDPGYGIARITGYTSGTQVSATVITKFPMPAGVVGGGNTTWRWTFGAWGDHNEYPTKVTLWRDRLIFAGSRTLWMSVASDYESFAPDDAGQQTTESGITITPASADNNAIRWMQAADALLIGTAGAEFAILPATDSDPLGPANIKVLQQSSYGSRNIAAPRIGDAVFFVDRSGRRLRELRFDIDSNAYQARDVTILAEHITAGGVTSLAFQQAPDSVLWGVRADGVLLGFTYEREQEVYGWHRHTFDGTVEDVAVIPSPDGMRDDVWILTLRTIDGATVRYVEYLDAGYETGDAQEDAFYVECGLTYDGVPADTITDLGHLEGETVTVLADGATHPDRVVTGGQITLDREASVVHVGLPYTAKLKTMRLEAGAPDGASQGRIKRIDHVTLRFLDSLGAKVGPSFTALDTLTFRTGSDAMDSPPPLYTGDKTVSWRGGYETDAQMCLQSDQPLPCTLVALFPKVSVSER